RVALHIMWIGPQPHVLRAPILRHDKRTGSHAAFTRPVRWLYRNLVEDFANADHALRQMDHHGSRIRSADDHASRFYEFFGCVRLFAQQQNAPNRPSRILRREAAAIGKLQSGTELERNRLVIRRNAPALRQLWLNLLRQAIEAEQNAGGEITHLL